MQSVSVSTTTGKNVLREKSRVEATDEVELRTDAADGKTYTLDSFVSVYGGTRAKPPLEWTKAPTASHKKPPALKKHALAEQISQTSAHALRERLDGKPRLLWVSVSDFFRMQLRAVHR